jgi:hypothetical protein
MKTKLLVLIVLITALAAMVVPVMAAGSQQSTITGNPTAVTSITLDKSTISLSLDPTASQPIIDATTHMTAESNNPTGYTVKVVDAMDNSKAANAGHMREFSGASYGSNFLAANMTVDSASGADATDTQATLSGPGSSKTLQATSAPKQVSNKVITFSQNVAYSDPRLSAGNYQIVVEFDISTNA